MKTWLALLFLGKSIAVIGPLEDDLQACRDAIANDRAQFAMFAERAGHSIEDVTLDCVRARRRPAIGEQR
jgi:hypothetical protein